MLLTDDEIRAAIDAVPITKNYSTDVARAIERATLEKVTTRVRALDCAWRCGVGAEIARKLAGPDGVPVRLVEGPPRSAPPTNRMGDPISPYDLSQRDQFKGG